MTRHLATLTTLLKNAFDFEHWLDPCPQVQTMRELGLEDSWSLDQRHVDHELRRAPSFWRAHAANTQR